MNPIAKNITVVDESGQLYNPTYSKRADGLIKHGRARWVDDSTICLMCPPDINTEDEIMSNPNIQENNEPTHTDYAQQSIVDIVDLAQKTLSEIIIHKEYIDTALETFANREWGNSDTENELISCITRIVTEREQTNREIIAMLDRQLHDTEDNRISTLRAMMDIASDLPDELRAGAYKNIITGMENLLSEITSA